MACNVFARNSHLLLLLSPKGNKFLTSGLYNRTQCQILDPMKLNDVFPLVRKKSGLYHFYSQHLLLLLLFFVLSLILFQIMGRCCCPYILISRFMHRNSLAFLSIDAQYYLFSKELLKTFNCLSLREKTAQKIQKFDNYELCNFSSSFLIFYSDNYF